MLRLAVLAVVVASNVAFAGELPAQHYAAMSRDDCEAELTARKIEFDREDAPGVLAPVRLKGALHGVAYRTNLSEQQRETTVWEIADCRLVLALDDFAQILAKHDIVEVRHYSMYRKPRRDLDKVRSQHAGGLALDAARFIRKDGTKLDVLGDFKGRRGSKSCGAKARKVKDPAAIELREIVCEAVEQHLFTVVLTPNFNRAHRNHFHLEVTPNVKWFWVR
ncbi:MAG TPA: extensin family protein [Kofleriaceae bacterium]